MHDRSGRRAWVLVLFLMIPIGACSPATVNRTQASPQRYVSVVCGAVEHWKALLEVGASALITQSSSVQNASDYVNGVLRDTSAMIAEVEAVGAPALVIGRDLQSKVLQQLGTIGTMWAQAEARFKSLAVDQPATVVREIERPIRPEVSLLRAELRDDSGSAELSRAAAADSDCTMLFLRKARESFGA
jgi:hypothetical protein